LGAIYTREEGQIKRTIQGPTCPIPWNKQLLNTNIIVSFKMKFTDPIMNSKLLLSATVCYFITAGLTLSLHFHWRVNSFFGFCVQDNARVNEKNKGHHRPVIIGVQKIFLLYIFLRALQAFER
jgi:hypothetical protein